MEVGAQPRTLHGYGQPNPTSWFSGMTTCQEGCTPPALRCPSPSLAWTTNRRDWARNVVKGLNCSLRSSRADLAWGPLGRKASRRRWGEGVPPGRRCNVSPEMCVSVFSPV